MKHYLQSTTKTLYDSIAMIGPDGTQLCFCNLRRANWYISRALAKWDNEEHTSFTLKFKPNGNGQQDKFYQQQLKNQCVVCGTQENLTKHHIIPTMFRKHLPLQHKEHNHYDIVPICVEDHETYEKKADLLKATLLTNIDSTDKKTKRDVITLKSYIKLLDNVKTGVIKNIPPERIIEINSFVNNNKHLLEKIEPNEEIGKKLISNLAEHEIQKFIMLWREHFIQNAKPRHMPENWFVDFKSSL